jgi:hypothetical protein
MSEILHIHVQISHAKSGTRPDLASPNPSLRS